MRAAIYTRVSTEEQASSAAAQDEGARAWCAREGHVVVAIYADEGVSGAEWVHRPGVVALRADAVREPRPWDLLVVRDLDRLGRDGIRLPELLAHLDDHGIRVIEWSTGRPVELDGMMMVAAQIRSVVAQEERRQIAHRTRTALKQKADKGFVTGGVVYGYRNVRTPAGVVYEVHPDQAAVVRGIYERTAAGDSARVIAVGLNARGVASPRAEGGGTGSWCPSTVRAIVRSERYKGLATWGEVGSKYRGGTRVTVIRTDAVQYAVPAIVDAETWERAQDTSDRGRASADRPRRGGIPAKYLLVSHAVCAECLGPISSARTSSGKGASRRIFPAYTCGNARERGTCNAKWYRPTARLDAVVLDWLATEVLSPEGIRAACDRARELARAAESAPDPRIEALRVEEEEISRILGRLTAALEHGAGDVPEVVAKMRERRARLDTVRAELSALTAPALVVSIDAERAIVEAAAQMRVVLDAGAAERPDLVRGVLGAVLVGRLRVGMTDGRLWIEGESAPSRLVWHEPGGTRGTETTPTGIEPVLPT